MAKFFFYGTLREKGKTATHVLPGFLLHKYTWFPFIKEGEGQVVGNVRDVPEANIPAMDRYEGVPSGLYKRVLVKAVPLNKDKEEDVWVYVPGNLLREGEEYPVINSGDWFNQ